MKNILLAALFLVGGLPGFSEGARPISLHSGAEGAVPLAGMTDGAFLERLAGICHRDVEEFIEATLMEESYVEEFGRERAEDDAARYRQAVQALVDSVSGFYKAYLKYTQTCIEAVEHPYELELLDVCRGMLRRYIQLDFANLSNSMALWFPRVYVDLNWQQYEESNYLLINDDATEFEKCLSEYMNDTPSSDYYTSVIVEMRRNRLEEMRRIMLDIMQESGGGAEFLTGYCGQGATPEQVALFRAAEKAWDAYRDALLASLAPVHNAALSGTGSGGLVLGLHKVLLGSHMQMLVELMNLKKRQFDMY